MAGAPPRRTSAALRGRLFAAARRELDELSLLGDVGQPLDLSHELFLPDPATPAKEAAIEAKLLGGVVAHGEPPKGAQRSKLTLTSGFE
jgi:hypothetical protein